MMTRTQELFRTPPGDEGERWKILDVGSAAGESGRSASGWVDMERSVGRIETGLEDTERPGRARSELLKTLAQRYPGVRWFSDCAA